MSQERFKKNTFAAVVLDYISLRSPSLGGHGLLAYDSPYFYYIEGGSILSCREGASMLEYSYALAMAI